MKSSAVIEVVIAPLLNRLQLLKRTIVDDLSSTASKCAFDWVDVVSA